MIEDSPRVIRTEEEWEAWAAARPQRIAAARKARAERIALEGEAEIDEGELQEMEEYEAMGREYY